MGDLANTVAKLEREAAESRELRSIVERLDTEISFRMETVQEVGGELLELHGSLDDQIAEHDYMAVEQSAASVRGLVDVETVLPAIDAVLLLTALRDDGAIPDLTLPLASFADDSWDHPRLTQGDLDRVFEAALVRAEEQWQEIWGDQLWDDENERDTHREQRRAEAELEAVKERAARAGAHLMTLVDHIGDTLWPEVVEAVEAGDRDRAVRALAAANSAGRETEAAYKLYEVNLSIQFEKAPESMGAMGEFLSDAQDWLLSQ
ncbi:hypothetical protein AB0899_15260 [Streptomyces sp. NPDC007002]|uniref:hypothetical protein n=1 Tax=Streptomyces sp. NPDC007002 TaxID=3156910 RepID=UPI003456641B